MNVYKVTDRVMERFWEKVNKTETCWLWTAHCNSRNGYGEFYFDGKGEKAHRFLYQISVGPIPEGHELDHVKARGCVNRNCVNPAHLEAVTHHENMLRGDIGSQTSVGWAKRTHCRKNLHELTPDNLFASRKGGRGCKQCRKDSWKRYNERRKHQMEMS